MTRKEIEALKDRVQQLIQQAGPAVALIHPSEGGYTLVMAGKKHTAKEYSSLQEAKAAFDALRPSVDSPCVIIDV